FRNLTGKNEYDPLSKGLADMLITDLSKVKSLKVVERMRLQLLMEELKLGASNLADRSTVPRLGRLLGARRILSGGFALPQEKRLRMDAVSTEISTAQIVAQAGVSGDLERFFALEKQLVFDVLDEMGVKLSQEERDEIQKVPTESFMAFLAYCRGLDYEDRGMYREAAGEFQKAVELDPGFSQADEKLQETQALAETPMKGELQEVALIEQAQAEEEKAEVEEKPVISTADRLESITQSSVGGFSEQPEPTSTEERTAPQQQTTTILNVTVEW
ncbi:TPA: hypothetical protein EYP37_11405, partial [Candidatus Poribacteria bacterium]|nr:hypothetical protein [Candidatus Poribacteria bacterium]